MIYSTFSSFMTARSGIVASQLGLNITGQNMANVNTNGYTRQRVDLVSIGSYSGTSKIALSGVSVAGGVRAAGISQIRDPYLDARFRTEMAGLGEVDVQYSILNQLGTIFDEESMGGLTDLLNNLFANIQKLDGISGAEYDLLVKTQADLLCNMLNSYGKQINEIRELEEDQLMNIDIPRINEILTEIEELTVNIRKAAATGNNDFELEDARNLLLDELSSYMPIKVSYNTSPTNKNIQEITVSLNVPGGTNIELYNSATNNKAVFGAAKNGNQMEISINGVDQSGSFTSGVLKGVLDMLNSRGEWDSPANDVRGIPYYEEMINSFVGTFAHAMNVANANPKYDSSDPTSPQYYTLFETKDGTGNYSLTNIKIADAWRDGTYGVVQENQVPQLMSKLFGEKLEYKNANGSTFFTGTFTEFVKHFSISTLGADEAAASTRYSTKAAVVNSADNARLSLSSVSMDEETVNMIMYQKSYNASSRMMTTLDEALDQLINKTGIVGR